MSAISWFKPDEDLTGALVCSGELHGALDALSRELKSVDRFLRAGVDPPTRVIFSGPSGTGKTLAARWIAWQLKHSLAVVNLTDSSGSLIGETTKKIGEMFEAIRTTPKSILFVDEIDAVAPARTFETGAEVERSHATSAFFQRIDQLPASRIVLAATNFLEELDPALRRRFTTQITFSLPDRDARRRMLEGWLGERGPLHSSQLDQLADDTEGLTGAELRARAMAQARRAIMAGPSEKPKEDRAPDGVARGQEILRLLDAQGAASRALERAGMTAREEPKAKAKR